MPSIEKQPPTPDGLTQVTVDKYTLLALLEWRDAALRTCEHLGMLGHEMGAYLILCAKVDKAPVIGGVPRPDILEQVKRDSLGIFSEQIKTCGARRVD